MQKKPHATGDILYQCLEQRSKDQKPDWMASQKRIGWDQVLWGFLSFDWHCIAEQDLVHSDKTHVDISLAATRMKISLELLGLLVQTTDSTGTVAIGFSGSHLCRPYYF